MRKGEISQELYDALDKTIESVCDAIQKEDTHSDEYAHRVTALAALVKARAKLPIIESDHFEAGTSGRRYKR